MDSISLIPQFGSLIWTIVAFVIALSVIVAIHEYGHYIVGRWSGIHADVFSIGFGPVLWSGHDRRGTRWQIAALPFGGYVKFAGDANAASGADEEVMAEVADDPVARRRTMHGAPLWARALTVAAGPVFNFALSFLIFLSMAMLIGVARDPVTVGELAPLPQQVDGVQPGDVVLEVAGQPLPDGGDVEAYLRFIDGLPDQATIPYRVERDGAEIEVEGPHYALPLVGRVLPTSAAYDAGLLAGDVITAIDGQPIFAFRQLKDTVEASDGKPLQLDVWRDGETLQVTLAAKSTDEPQADGGFKNNLRIGIAGATPFTPATEPRGFGEAVRLAVASVWGIITQSISGLGHMITGAISTCNMSGPIGIAQVSGAVASQGAVPFIEFIAVLSTAVGLLNLFPIPALDGGHLVFYAYEAVTGRPPNDKALRFLMALGIGLVLTLMIFALSMDLFCP